MENKNDLPGSDLVGKYCHLPDDQLVVVEAVYPNGSASVRRIDGERAGTDAICRISELRPE